MSRSYPAKLLLFGEYSVLNGSQALAVPLHQWQGKWLKGESASSGNNDALFTYVDWLRDCHWITITTADQIKRDAMEGWVYQSDIPVGYGLGSSGAFVAAIFDKYMAKDIADSQATILETLADMEGYFHGSSSGMDPMVSYADHAMFKDDQGKLHAVKDPGWPAEYQVFLLDSGIGRATGPLVEEYKEKFKNDSFRINIETKLIPMVDHAIHFYLSGSNQMFEDCIAAISRFQREYFASFIPDPVKELWDKLIAHPGVYVKLCGAGGGGYFLVISNSKSTTSLLDPLIRIV